MTTGLPFERAGSDWTEVDRRARGTRFIAIQSRSVLNSATATNMAFWSINPYIGCEFGCAYCYARDTHRWAVERAANQLNPAAAAAEAEAMSPVDAFERRILVKRNAAALLAHTLKPSRLHGQSLIIGTATDPYQPAERRFGVTRSLLETLLNYRGVKLGIITKSPLIARDTDLLVALSQQHTVTVNLSLASFDAALLRRLEPRTPTPRARLRAMLKLTGAGVRVGLLIAPILPGITDGRNALRALMMAAKACGATWIAGLPLRMGAATRRTLFPWMARERPDLALRYQRHYAQRQAVSHAYDDALRRRLRSLQMELGMEPQEGRRQERALVAAKHDTARQLDLWK